MNTQVEQQVSAGGPSQDGGSVASGHLLTVNVEDYFQVGVFQKFIKADHWYRFESRLKRNVERVLQLLDYHNAKATFFTLGWTAEKDPQLVRDISDAGHEVSSRGFLHQRLSRLTPEKIQRDLKYSRMLLEDVTGKAVRGFRMSDGWLDRSTLWLLDEIAEAGYAYDSSLMPNQKEFRGSEDWRCIRTIETKNGPLTEVPLTVMDIPGGWLPIAGGNYHRQMPDFVMRRLVDKFISAGTHPFVMYFQVWELDSEQPRLSVADRLTRLRHYRKLGKLQRTLPQYLERYNFTSINHHSLLPGSPLQDLKNFIPPNRERGPLNPSQHLHVNAQSLAIRSDDLQELADSQAGGDVANSAVAPRDVTLVIPCFNEEKSLTYLANTLSSVRARLKDRWKTRVLFVDDCSTDDTYNALNQIFAADDAVQVVRHKTNKGVSGAILTGLQHAKTDIVASMDCDCSYDPHELDLMLPLMTDGVSMVTASPYHKDGLVRNVPGWRLFLSRGLSWIYQRMLKQPLATWTSCFRIYRRDHILGLPLTENGFLGTAELAAQLVRHDRKIVEHPATLEVRLFGLSKMKTVRAIGSHLKLLWRLWWSGDSKTTS